MRLQPPNDDAIARELVHSKILTKTQLNEVQILSRRWGTGLGETLQTKKWADPSRYYHELARIFALPFVRLSSEEADPTLLNSSDVAEYMQAQVVPWRKTGKKITAATSRPCLETFDYVKRRWGRDTAVVVCTKNDLTLYLQAQTREQFSHDAVFDLAKFDPVMSAQSVFMPFQLIVAWCVLSVFAVFLYFKPTATLIFVNLLMSLFYLGNFVFKAAIVWAGHATIAGNQTAPAYSKLPLQDKDLPDYTILVPMFREPNVLPILANALRKLDYPTAKLDIKIVLEEGDHETIAAANSLNLEDIFEVILVPPSQPQTKPKACNYALRFARGEYLVIFDAEDKPEPDQLKKVVEAFRNAPDNVACVQCRLNYYNRNENWLTRMFTLDYSLWFDLMLPGLERLGVPIPLGGTSNHFKMSVLRELRAWDPFNVTEDADLGIRMTQKGYRVILVDSTTFEEANVSQLNWIRQRSRWIKGYMQTFLVHTRRPLHLARTVGPLGLIGFIFFIGGTMLSGLLNPMFWAVFIFWLLTGANTFNSVFPPALLYLSMFNLLAGNALFVFLMMLAPYRRNWLELVPFALTVFWYWVLMSIAAWKGAWQLITKPFYWEKTNHGLSKHTAIELAEAKAANAAAVL